MKIIVIAFASLILCSFNIFGQVSNIIPKPQKVEIKDGEFNFSKKTKITYYNDSIKGVIDLMQTEIKNRFGLDIKTSKPSESIETGAINFQYKKDLEAEAYILTVENNKIICEASTKAGFFYATQSLLQAINTNNKKISAECFIIEDKPLYAWRGFMLDVVRHFSEKELIKKYLDVMANLKLNVFHWHLTDEQAWRIEIKKYPLLTEIGSSGSWSDKDAPHAYYTQEDVKEIVAYAAQRFITVIPEIDMPGHATAVSRAYPEISGGGEGKWKGFTFHPAKEYTYEFISNIFTEIAELFPAPYIHVGGDEVHYGNQSWFTDPLIQKFIKDNYLIDEVGMEHYFVRRVCEIVNSKGKKMLGWDEILNAGVNPKKAAIMWWRQERPELLAQALSRGFDVILTPRLPCYLDFVQDDSHKIGRRWGKAFNKLSDTYSFPEAFVEKYPKNTKQFLGIQANLWMERVADEKRRNFMIFPRLLAIAEDGWTKTELKDYSNFEERVKIFFKYLDTLNINYFNLFDKDTTPEPWGPDKEDAIANG